MYYIHFADGPEAGREILQKKAPKVLTIYSMDGERLIYRKVDTAIGRKDYPVCIYELVKRG